MEENKTKPEFILVAGNKTLKGDLIHDKWIYLTEEEYNYMKKYLKNKGSIDELGNRIDKKVNKTQQPYV